MRYFVVIIVLLGLAEAGRSQSPTVYTIKADSVKLTNCDSSELIIENHTQNIPGFLFNTGNGRTIFKRGLQTIAAGSYIIGADTLKLATTAWLQGGNAFGTTGILGTLDSNHLDFYTNNVRRGRWTNTGNLVLGGTADNGNRLTVNGNLNILTPATTSGLVITSSISGNSGNFTITPNASPIGGPPDFTLSSTVDGRLFFNTFQGIFSNGLNAATLTVTGGASTGPLLVTGNTTITSSANNSDNYSFFSAAPNTKKAAIIQKSLGSWGRTDLYFALNNATDTSTVQSTDTKVAFKANGNVLIGSTTDIGNMLQVNGSIFTSTYLTNTTTALGSTASGGSIRLRWGTGDGEYMSFFKQANTNRRGYIASAADTRPLQIFDSVGVSLYKSPYLAIGSELSINAKLSIVDSVGSPLYDFVAGRASPDSFYYDFFVQPPGTVSYADFADHGALTQINGRTAIAGNLGVGIATPAAQLHTTGTVRFAGLTQDSTQTRVLVSDASGNLYYRSASSLAIDEPLRSSLAVNGPITAEKLTLTTKNWPDYVFDSSYSLLPLDHLESYIRQHSHLPGIPSAATVEKNNVDVGEMQAALLKKIEELSLYVIRLEHEVDALKKANRLSKHHKTKGPSR